ncbi:MAG: hypothetical protein ACJ754_27495 [Pyrinomonadaceae bacterium]
MTTASTESRRAGKRDAPVVAWLKGPQRIRGLDPLGVRAPCESLYTQLLPGINNVTDRARYFSFYPWLVWAVERHAGSLKGLPLYHTIRRADCLFTLIGLRHLATSGPSKLHGGLIGAITLSRAINQLSEGETLRLSEFSTTDPVPERYFQNRHGGLGQYYLGTLQQAGLLLGDARSGIRYTEERGGPLARAFDDGVDREAFFAALEADEVTTDTLDYLSAFCACAIEENAVEHSALADYFFNRESIFHQEEGQPRRLTLALLLDLCERLQGSDTPLTVDGGGSDVFRACAYAGAMPGGASWDSGISALDSFRQGWGLYHRHELFSVAIQCLFWAGLDALQGEGVALADSRAYGQWFAATFEGALDGGGKETLASAVARTAGALPPLELWEDPEHEVQLGWTAHNLTREQDARFQREDVVRDSVRVLLALAARGQGAAGRETPFGLSQHHLIHYPVNLHEFERLAGGEWGGLPMRDLLARLGARWGVDAHLRVALRKLRGSAHDTFKIVPGERGLTVTESPLPGFTGPRVRQALQVLYDLRALDYDPTSGGMRPTDFGLEMLEECRAD